MLTIKKQQYIPQKLSLSLGAFAIGMIGTIGILHAIDPSSQPKSTTTETRVLGDRHVKNETIDSLPTTSKERVNDNNFTNQTSFQPGDNYASDPDNHHPEATEQATTESPSSHHNEPTAEDSKTQADQERLPLLQPIHVLTELKLSD